MTRCGDVTPVSVDGYHAVSQVLFPCLLHYRDISKVETNCITLVKIAALIFILCQTDLVAMLPIRCNTNKQDLVQVLSLNSITCA